MSYQPVMHAGSRLWMLGRIEYHTARPLTREEVDAVCGLLNSATPAVEWLITQCEQFQQRAHEAEREVLRLRGLLAEGGR